MEHVFRFLKMLLTQFSQMNMHMDINSVIFVNKKVLKCLRRYELCFIMFIVTNDIPIKSILADSFG